MPVEIPCPNCGEPVDPQARTCVHCGVDLALAAVVAERDVASLPELPGGVPLAPEVLVPRVGDLMIEKGIIKPADLQRALKYQKKRSSEGSAVLLGQALLELGLVSRGVLDEVITSQILQLQNALKENNRQLEKRVLDRTLDLQRALDRLTELNQLKSNFIANISHELRTPLTHIKGYLEILIDGGLGQLNDQQINVLKILNQAEGRLERLIEDLIQFSLVARGELSLKLEVFRLEELLSVVLNTAKQKARMKNISLGIELAQNLPPVKADREKIGWVLTQLVDNALKFTPSNGRVEVTACLENTRVEIAVSDTGIGIPSNRIAEIFEPFHQLDGSSTRRYSGTGLGLAMVRKIIEAHGSHIKVQSVEGKGSRFEFSMAIDRIPSTVGNPALHPDSGENVSEG